MKKVMNRIWTVALLTIVSMAAKAEITVDIDKSIPEGAVVVKSQSEPAEDGSVVVTITVTPPSGTYISKNDVVVYETFPLGTREDETTKIGERLTLTAIDGEPADKTAARDYSFTVKKDLGAWVAEANFHSAEDLYKIGTDESSDVRWEYDESSKTLSITGSGDTKDFGGEGEIDPLEAYRATIETVTIEKGVTSLGANIFKNCTALTSIVIQNYSQVLTLGTNALPDNEGLTIDVYGNLYNEYLITNGWKELKNHISSSNAVSMTGVEFDSNNNFDTFVSSEKSLMIPSVFEAYTITGVKGNTLILTKVTGAIPQGVPVLVYAKNNLKGDEFFSAETSENGDVSKTNYLKVDKEDRTVEVGEVYMLFNDTFYFTQSGTITAGRVYMEIPKSEPASNTEKTRGSYSLNGSTGIATMQYDGLNSSTPWYGLDGHQYTTMPTRKGVYIKDGKKVVVK